MRHRETHREREREREREERRKKKEERRCNEWIRSLFLLAWSLQISVLVFLPFDS